MFLFCFYRKQIKLQIQYFSNKLQIPPFCQSSVEHQRPTWKSLWMKLFTKRLQWTSPQKNLPIAMDGVRTPASEPCMCCSEVFFSLKPHCGGSTERHWTWGTDGAILGPLKGRGDGGSTLSLNCWSCLKNNELLCGLVRPRLSPFFPHSVFSHLQPSTWVSLRVQLAGSNGPAP